MQDQKQPAAGHGRLPTRDGAARVNRQPPHVCMAEDAFQVAYQAGAARFHEALQESWNGFVCLLLLDGSVRH